MAHLCKKGSRGRAQWLAEGKRCGIGRRSGQALETWRIVVGVRWVRVLKSGEAKRDA